MLIAFFFPSICFWKNKKSSTNNQNVLQVSKVISKKKLRFVNTTNYHHLEDKNNLNNESFVVC